MSFVGARVSFAGTVTMGAGEKREIKDEEIVKDLEKAGYVEVLDEEVKAEPKKKTSRKSSGKKEASGKKRGADEGQ